MRFKKKLLAALITGMLLPMAAQAAEADLLKKIEALAEQIEVLKNQVKANEEKAQSVATKPDSGAVAELKSQVKRLEDKSLSKWLTVGGDFHTRYDYLEGQTKSFTDVNATFVNAKTNLQNAFFSSAPVPPGYPSWQNQIGGFMQFQTAMDAVKTYDDATKFPGTANSVFGTNGVLLGNLGQMATPVPAYKAKNNSLLTNRFNLDIGAKATENVSVNARLAMYKVFGAQNEAAITNAGSAPFFADRVGVFDGTLSHVPSSSALNVDRAYATWSNIADRDLWFSIGRRPSTGGAPNNLKQNEALRPGKGGTPGLLVDYAFDGMTVGYAPEIEALPGAYGKICYGRGFESGFRNPTNSLADTNMLGIALVPIDTDPLRVWLQWNRGMHIFDAPTMNNTYFGNTTAKADLGDIDWLGAGFMSTFKKVGSGDLQLYGDVALSMTRPNNNVSSQFGFQGLMTGAFFQPEAPTNKTGSAIALGMRYDLPSKTKLGFEFNHGSKNWITFAPAADDMWTAKAGTRGEVYEAYMIQELDVKPISSYFSRAFFRLGVQHYNFKYTGSNNWVGAPVDISTVNGQLMATTPLKNATNLYATFDVKF
jgi:hypothetical protein